MAISDRYLLGSVNGKTLGSELLSWHWPWYLSTSALFDRLAIGLGLSMTLGHIHANFLGSLDTLLLFISIPTLGGIHLSTLLLSGTHSGIFGLTLLVIKW